MHSLIDQALITSRVNGYGTTLAPGTPLAPDLTTDEYAQEQLQSNVAKTRDFVLPIIDKCGARAVVDIGCGLGTMAATLFEQGYDAYGVDVSGLSGRWAQLDLPRDRFVIVDPARMRLPFPDNSVDFVFSLGVIEHVGTSDGHSDRLPDWHERRAEWLHELLRTVKPGGSLLLGGPNRGFPVDVAHGLDSKASRWERALSRFAGMSVHKTWGDNFLWSYRDFEQYLAGRPCELEALNVDAYLHYSRVPWLVRSLARTYVSRMPAFMLKTGFNPWTMALIRKTSA